MTIYTVALPDEYDELATQIEAISIENKQSISRTIRDILCQSLNFTPVLTREIRKRNMYKSWQNEA
jgi:hypothetical protein